LKQQYPIIDEAVKVRYLSSSLYAFDLKHMFRQWI